MFIFQVESIEEKATTPLRKKKESVFHCCLHFDFSSLFLICFLLKFVENAYYLFNIKLIN